MANSKDDDGVEHIDAEDARMQWPTTATVVNKLGVHKRTVENMVRTGSLRYVYAPDNSRRFNPEDLEVAADKPLTEKAIEAESEAHVMTTLWKLVGTLSKSNGDLLKLATDPAKSFTELLIGMLTKQQEAYERLQDKYHSGIEAFETALNNQSERDIAKQKQASQDKRLDNALDKALEQLPAIVAGLSAKKAVSGFFDTLTTEQKGFLFDMLTPAQLTLLGQVQKHFTKPNGASGESSSGASEEKEGEKPS